MHLTEWANKATTDYYKSTGNCFDAGILWPVDMPSLFFDLSASTWIFDWICLIYYDKVALIIRCTCYAGSHSTASMEKNKYWMFVVSYLHCNTCNMHNVCLSYYIQNYWCNKFNICRSWNKIMYIYQDLIAHLIKYLMSDPGVFYCQSVS